MSLPILVFLFFTFLGFLLSIFFFLKKHGDHFANRLLGLYTFLFALEMLHGCLKWSGLLVSPYFTHFTLINALLWTSYGPIVYAYIRRVFTAEGMQLKDFILWLPTAIVFLLHSPFYFKSTRSKIDIITRGETYEHAIFPPYAIWLVIMVMTFYAVYTFIIFTKKKAGYRETVWLKWFMSTYIGFVFFFFLYVFLVRFDFMEAKYDYFIDAIITIFIIALAYFGFVQPEVFKGAKPLKELIPFTKYRKTGLTPLLSTELKNKLDGIMEDEKPYLNHDLRLNDVATLLNVSRNHASQIINENYNLSFFDFVNKYRIDEAIRLLLNNENVHLNITQIAYSSGFNSRASFYKAFKKFTDVSPTSYLKHISAS
ncbi:AraC family transcriptional regulator [Spongiivirga sp. MCCC 1A20706]|uniref:helix-turn-helix domain-containing protein n=1 Tax=Spongiivirga sp. MCCC 1A20706 TaxID=3160963 RepID=UPI00397771ED